MDDVSRREEKFTDDLEDLLPLIEELKSIPRQRPRLSFELRMWLYSFAPDRAAKAIERGRQARTAPRGTAHTTGNRALRSAACAALACILALGVFTGLLAAGRNSLPGDSLYFTKGLMQRLELAFTWSNTRKAEKQIAYASQKLSDIDCVVRDARSNPGAVASSIKEYQENVRSVGRLLQEEDSIPAEDKVVAQLESLKAKEKQVMDRVAAVKPESVLAAASLARLEVKDASGSGSLGDGVNSLSGTADENGSFSFKAMTKDGKVPDLDVRIELDGRRAVIPLSAESATRASVSGVAVEVRPDRGVLPLKRPVTFTATFTDPGGAPLAGREVRLRDRSQSGLINGEAGEVRLTTDSEGRVEFIFKKSSVSSVSRVEARLLRNGSWLELGDVLVLGGVETPGSAPAGSAVSARTVTSDDGATSIQLDNGLVSVTVNGSSTGHVVTGIRRSGGGTVFGPLVDPSVTTMSAKPSQEGFAPAEPVLFYTDMDAAGYEVSCETKAAGGTESRTYRVMLCRDERFATVLCKSRGGAPTGVSSEPAQVISTEILSMELPRDTSEVKLSGKSVGRPSGNGSTTVVPFSLADPLALYKAGGETAVIAIPPESLSYPDSWSLGKDGIGIRLSRPSAGGAPDWSLTAIAGFADGRRSADRFLETVSGYRGYPLQGYLPDATSNGAFLVNASYAPVGDDPSPTNKHFELSIFKAYEAAPGK